jgi:hypothetical protein
MIIAQYFGVDLMERRVGIHKATREDGSIIQVEEYQEFIDVTSFSDSAKRWAPGMKRLELEDGSAVNFIDERTFEIVESGERLALL